MEDIEEEAPVRHKMPHANYRTKLVRIEHTQIMRDGDRSTRYCESECVCLCVRENLTGS